MKKSDLSNFRLRDLRVPLRPLRDEKRTSAGERLAFYQGIRGVWK